MAVIVMADDGVQFDGQSPERGPLGGAEGAFVSLAEAFAARGHAVRVYNNCAAPLIHNSVAWTPLNQGSPYRADIYIANRGHRLLGLVPHATRRIFWVHNPARYLKKPRYIWPLWRWRPLIVTLGDYAASTVPAWMPKAGVAALPYGLAEDFRHAKPRPVPKPVAIFASNPQRGLDWLLDVWAKRIHPAVPKSELRLYAGPAVYGAAGERQEAAMAPVLARADGLADQGVKRLAPVSRNRLIDALNTARVMLYRGDVNETFCAAVAEAQALGVPVVAQPIGSLPERIIDGVTGYLASDDETFAQRAIALLSDDALWLTMHKAALEKQRGLSWDDVAARFEGLLR